MRTSRSVVFFFGFVRGMSGWFGCCVDVSACAHALTIPPSLISTYAHIQPHTYIYTSLSHKRTLPRLRGPQRRRAHRLVQELALVQQRRPIRVRTPDAVRDVDGGGRGGLAVCVGWREWVGADFSVFVKNSAGKWLDREGSAHLAAAVCWWWRRWAKRRRTAPAATRCARV